MIQVSLQEQGVMKEMVSFFYFCLICSCLPRCQMNSLLFINETTAEQRMMRLTKRKKKPQKDEEGGKYERACSLDG